MKQIKRLYNYFTATERILWFISVLVIIGSAALLGGWSTLSVFTSVLGTTALILNAKANPAGQALTIVFSLLYAVISYSFKYYGEMITYLGMTLPMAAFSLAVWLRHPYGGKKSEVEICKISLKEQLVMWLLNAVVTGVFYFILKLLGTANLIPSTISVTTSFAAAYLTARRSPYYALAYAANDIVLTVLWTSATLADIKYLSVTVCFSAFLANDIYGFISWQRIARRQAAGGKATACK